MADESKLTPEEVAALLEGAGVPQSVLFYIMMGGIARLRNLIQNAAARGGMDNSVESSHFGDVQSGVELESPVEKGKFVYSTLTHGPLRVVNWGLPTGKSKLEIPAKGLAIRLPYAVEWVRVRGAHYADTAITLQGCRNQEVLSESSAQPNGDAMYTLTVKGEEINRVLLTANGGESLFLGITIPKANGYS